MVSCWIAAHKKLLSFCLVNAAFYSNLKKNWLSPFRIGSLDFSVFWSSWRAGDIFSFIWQGTGKARANGKMGPEAELLSYKRFRGNTERRRGDESEFFCGCCEFLDCSIGRVWLDGLFGGICCRWGGLMRCQRCKGCRWNRGRFRFGLIIPGKSFAAEVQGFVRI